MLEDRVRHTLHDVATATPVPDGWAEIEARARRSTRAHRLVPAVAVVLALVVAAGALVTQRRERGEIIGAAAPHAAARVSFPRGPTVEVSALAGEGRVAFVSGGRVYIVDGDAGTVRRVTEGGDASDLAWSADGQWIAFSVRDAGGEDYTSWVARADGSHAKRLVDRPWSFAWSPSGHLLALNSEDGLVTVEPSGTRRTIVPVLVRSFAWSPDGRTIAYSLDPGLSGGRHVTGVFTVSARGGTPTRRLTPSGDSAVGVEGWWRDGRGLVLDGVAGLEAIDLASGTRRGLVRVASSGSGAALLAWSPDGSRFAAPVDDGPGKPKSHMAVCEPSTATCTTLALPASVTSYVMKPAWSPDGTRLTYVAEETGGRSLWVQPVDGGEPRLIERLRSEPLQGGEDPNPNDSVPVGFGEPDVVPEWSHDGAMLLYRTGAELRLATVNSNRLRVRVARPVGFRPNRHQSLPAGAIVAWTR
jgi:dipeptidyl aminopeptidase/acylaminoacyl peptidase